MIRIIVKITCSAYPIAGCAVRLVVISVGFVFCGATE